MKARVIYLFHMLSENFWFLPTLMTLAAVALSAFTLALDRDPSTALYHLLPWSEGLGLSNARLIMSTISGSIITAASLVFSLTLVALTLACGQLGPRLLSLFMRDRMTQAVLGIFVATFVFALLILANLGEPTDTVVVPRASIFTALLLTLLSFGLLIAFIHHLAMSLHADVVVAKLAQDLSAQIEDLLGKHEGPSKQREGAQIQWDNGRSIQSNASGYVQTIDCSALVEIARAHDTEILLKYRAGHFVSRGEAIALIRDECDELGDLESAVCSLIVLGQKRTDAEDPEFAFQAIVEIGLRALSPGVNDPHTALTCIDWLGEALAQVLKRDMPDYIFLDEDGMPRLRAVPLSLKGFFETAFDELRQAAEGNVAVLIRLVETFMRLGNLATTSEQHDIIRHHAEMLGRSCERSITETFDRKDVQKRLSDLELVLSG